ncbi:septum formation initiator family protein [Leucobacter denitrificans]|uniref:Septum formation initiator family protein n=1 Tax=Leucobacter denitrificans TaxID=683042 RepID=A0A7G9S4K3_9MICO|nr:septum formation initiator family protein [Leucobacter denitrificans]QNN62778.1 septum formation initiator family protein [Leucobacter denitrificans]
MKRWREDLAAWAQSLRFSGFTVIVVVSVIGGALILSPNISTFVQQRREISQLRESVRQHREAVEAIDAERAQWRDPAYVRAQARDRLSYVLPGETQLSIIADIVLPAESDEETSADLTQVERNWAKDLATSLIAAGSAVPETPSEDEAARSDE